MALPSVEKATYRVLLRQARAFDCLPVAKALVYRRRDLEPVEACHNLYGVALKTILGSGAYHLSPERASLSWMNLIRDLSRDEKWNIASASSNDVNSHQENQTGFGGGVEDGVSQEVKEIFQKHFPAITSPADLSSGDRVDAGE
ncbi:unnamed protein product [Choristocarpus tenellus]